MQNFLTQFDHMCHPNLSEIYTSLSMQDISGAGVYDELRAESVKIMEDPCISCAYKSNTTKPVCRLGSRYINLCIYIYIAFLIVHFMKPTSLYNTDHFCNFTTVMSPRLYPHDKQQGLLLFQRPASEDTSMRRTQTEAIGGS